MNTKHLALSIFASLLFLCACDQQKTDDSAGSANASEVNPENTGGAKITLDPNKLHEPPLEAVPSGNSDAKMNAMSTVVTPQVDADKNAAAKIAAQSQVPSR